jgi:hypothetical protein
MYMEYGRNEKKFEGQRGSFSLQEGGKAGDPFFCKMVQAASACIESYCTAVEAALIPLQPIHAAKAVRFSPPA